MDFATCDSLRTRLVSYGSGLEALDWRAATSFRGHTQGGTLYVRSMGTLQTQGTPSLSLALQLSAWAADRGPYSGARAVCASTIGLHSSASLKRRGCPLVRRK